MNKKKITAYPDALFDLIEKVSRGQEVVVDFSSPREANGICQEFYNFRSVLREVLENADKITLRVEDSNVLFSRKLSVYSVRFQEGVKSDDNNQPT